LDAVKWRVAEGYSRSAPLYDALAGEMYAGGIRRLLPLLRVPPLPAVLDIGTGTGISLFEAMRAFGPCRLAAGVDISPGMVAVAAQKARRLGLPATFTVGDAEALPFPPGVFDVAIANSCYHWFNDKVRALSEVRRVLRPGGELVLIAAAVPCFIEWFAALEAVLMRFFGPGARTGMPVLPTREELARNLNGAGFVPRHLNYQRQQIVITNPQLFTRILATVAPQWSAGLPPGTQAAVEHQVANRLQSVSPQGTPVTWAALEAIATRVL